MAWRKYRDSLNWSIPFILLAGERHYESTVSCPGTQHSDPGQCSNPDHSIRSPTHQPLGHHIIYNQINSFVLLRGPEKEEIPVEKVTKTRKTRRAKEASCNTGSDFPKLAYLTVEEFEEIPK